MSKSPNSRAFSAIWHTNTHAEQPKSTDGRMMFLPCLWGYCGYHEMLRRGIHDQISSARGGTGGRSHKRTRAGVISIPSQFRAPIHGAYFWSGTVKARECHWEKGLSLFQKKKNFSSALAILVGVVCKSLGWVNCYMRESMNTCMHASIHLSISVPLFFVGFLFFQ